MKTQLILLTTGLCVMTSAFWLRAQAQPAPLFSDDFETDTSANWSVLDGSGSGTSDYTAEFSFNYGATKYTFTNTVTHTVVTNTIPPAPNSSGGATRGVKLTVNKNDDVADTAGVSIYPKGQTFQGNYALRFDLWINYNGGAGGGSGSTEYATFGINHSGAVVNWTDLLPQGDGVWYATTGEGGAARDYRAYEFDGTQTYSLSTAEAGQIGGNAAEGVFVERFPAGVFETTGAVGKRWVQVEVSQRDGVLVWKIDGYVIAERANASSFTSGTIMLGTMDIFTSIANPKADNFVIFDNVRVVDLAGEAELATVRVEASDSTAGEAGPDSGTLVITRAGGDQTKPLDVTGRITGTAVAGLDYQNIPSTVTIPANESSVAVTIQPINDELGEAVETVTLTLVNGPGYEMRDAVSATVEVLDDGDLPIVQVRATDVYAYERMSEDTAAFDVSRQGLATEDLNVQLTVGGTATAGADYETIQGTLIIPAGQTNVLVLVMPLNDAELEGDETVSLSVQALPTYKVGGTGQAAATILDDERPEGSVLFSDDFDTDSSGSWERRFGAGNGIEDYTVDFRYDYSADGIGAAPHSDAGSTLGLRATVNKNDTTANAAGVNLYPKARSFSGNFALRFDMYLTYNPSVGGTTEHALFGINHSGSLTNRHGTAGSDGVWFAVETDGSASRGWSYASYLGSNGVAQAQGRGRLDAYFTKPPYLAAGTPSGQWVDVEVAQVDGVVTWTINGVEVIRRTDTTAFASGTVMLGYMDSYNSIGSTANAVIFDNVRVVALAAEPTPPMITAWRIQAGNLEIDFASATGAAPDFSVVSSATVTGPYLSEAGATVLAVSAGQFRASVALGGPAMKFYQIKR
jgi:hypothetical protein